MIYHALYHCILPITFSYLVINYCSTDLLTFADPFENVKY